MLHELDDSVLERDCTVRSVLHWYVLVTSPDSNLAEPVEQMADGRVRSTW